MYKPDELLLGKHFGVPADKFEWLDWLNGQFVWWYTGGKLAAIRLGSTEEALSHDPLELQCRLAFQQMEWEIREDRRERTDGKTLHVDVAKRLLAKHFGFPEEGFTWEQKSGGEWDWWYQPSEKDITEICLGSLEMALTRNPLEIQMNIANRIMLRDFDIQ